MNVLPWQQAQWQRLVAARRAARLPHAVMLEGVAGAGKWQFARALAAALLCPQPGPEGHACGQCRACALVAAGSHPDLGEVAPEEAGKALKVDRIRALIDVVGLSSQFGGMRVVLLGPAEAMNRSAANALLKTLEEPPPSAVMVLVSHQPSLVPITVRSRCQRIAFRPGGDPAARAWLEQRLDGDVDAATLLALADGGPLAAERMAADGTLELHDTLVTDLDGLARGAIAPVAAAERWQGHGGARVLEIARRLVEDLAVAAAAGSGVPRGRGGGDLQALAKGLDLTRLLGARDKLLRFRRLLATSPGLREQDLLTDFALYWAAELGGGGTH